MHPMWAKSHVRSRNRTIRRFIMNTIVTLAASAATVWTWILGIVVCLLAVAISVMVSLQSTKEGGGLSGTITGSAGESFFGKSKTMTKDRLLSRLTLIASIIFVILVLVLTIIVTANHGA